MDMAAYSRLCLLCRLLGTFQLPPAVKKDTFAPAPQPKSVIGSLFGSSSGSSEPASSVAVTASPPPAPVPIPKVSSPSSAEEDDRRSIISTAPIGASQLRELGREAVIHGFATVAVGRGDTVSKEDGGAKKHVGYEVSSALFLESSHRTCFSFYLCLLR